MKLTKNQIFVSVASDDDSRRPLKCIHVKADGCYSSDGKRLLIVHHEKWQIDSETSKALPKDVLIPVETLKRVSRLLPRRTKKEPGVRNIDVDILPEDNLKISLNGRSMGYLQEDISFKIKKIDITNSINFAAVIPDSISSTLKIGLNGRLLSDLLLKMLAAGGSSNSYDGNESIIFTFKGPNDPVLMKYKGYAHEITGILQPVRLRD